MLNIDCMNECCQTIERGTLFKDMAGVAGFFSGTVAAYRLILKIKAMSGVHFCQLGLDVSHGARELYFESEIRRYKEESEKIPLSSILKPAAFSALFFCHQFYLGEDQNQAFIECDADNCYEPEFIQDDLNNWNQG